MGLKKLHLGCGDNYLEGWINIDKEVKAVDKKLDLRKRLPYPTHSVSFIYNEHFLEHLTSAQAFKFLKECHRVLISTGIIRISTPDLKYLVKCYNKETLNGWEEEGRFPKTPCEMLNEGMRLWGHEFVYDKRELFTLLRVVGFTEIKICPWRQSEHPELVNLECRTYHKELIVEAKKCS